MKFNYLNNRDLLKEIHKSKNTYCTYLDISDGDYDIIINSLSEINDAKIGEAIELRSERLCRAAYDAAMLESVEKRKLEEFAVDPATISKTDLVFRVMTWEHVPEEAKKVPKGKAKILEDDDEIIKTEYDIEEDVQPTKYTKCNFPPFQHFKLNSNDEAYCVGKSHWKGDLITGEFCKDHGAMTKKLAHMFIKLCERYATRSNWRGYTYNDEMRSQALLQLSQIGLKFDESKSSNPFSYFTAVVTNSFTRVLNIEKQNQNLRDDILELNGMSPSYTRQGMSSSSSFGDGDYD
jgi:hypothetical protein